MKAVLIAGGSGGIGSAVAERAAQRGWSVLVGYGTGKSRAEAVAHRIQKEGGQAEILWLPLQDTRAVTHVIEEVASRRSRLEAVVLAASPPPVLASFLKANDEEFRSQWEINVLGAHALLAGCWKRFFSRPGGGHIVAVLSATMGPPPRRHMMSYVTAKWGLQAVLECAVEELGPAGLRVSGFSPDYTDTPMMQNLHPHILNAARAKRAFLSPQFVASRLVDRLDQPPSEMTLQIESLEGPSFS